MKNRRNLFAIVLAFAVVMLNLRVWAAPNEGPLLLDDYNRSTLGVEENGGAYNSPNSKGITIYWIQWANAVPVIEDNALKLKMEASGWFGEGGMIKDPAYKYIIMKVKGEKGGEEKELSINPDAKGSVSFKDLKGPDGNSIPVITKEYQNLVIDIEKSGFKLTEGFEAMHFNNVEAVTIYIDEIYLSKDGNPADFSVPAESGANDQPVTAEPEKEKPVEEDKTKENTASAPTSNKPTVEITKEASNNKEVLAGVIAGATLVAIGGVVYVMFIRKPN